MTVYESIDGIDHDSSHVYARGKQTDVLPGAHTCRLRLFLSNLMRPKHSLHVVSLQAKQMGHPACSFN